MNSFASLALSFFIIGMVIIVIANKSPSGSKRRFFGGKIIGPGFIFASILFGITYFIKS